MTSAQILRLQCVAVRGSWVYRPVTDAQRGAGRMGARWQEGGRALPTYKSASSYLLALLQFLSCKTEAQSIARPFTNPHRVALVGHSFPGLAPWPLAQAMATKSSPVGGCDHGSLVPPAVTLPSQTPRLLK